MSTQLYTVTLTDLGTYRLTVAADTPAEAESIAKTVLFEEMTTLTPESRVVKREADAKAEVSAEPPLRTFNVHGVYELRFSLKIPAADLSEAQRHARRIYNENCGPFEFEHDGGELTRLFAEEVRP